MCGDETDHSALSVKLSEIQQECPHFQCNPEILIPETDFVFGSSIEGFLSPTEAIANAHIAQSRDLTILDALYPRSNDTTAVRSLGSSGSVLKLRRFLFEHMSSADMHGCWYGSEEDAIVTTHQELIPHIGEMSFQDYSVAVGDSPLFRDACELAALCTLITGYVRVYVQAADGTDAYRCIQHFGCSGAVSQFQLLRKEQANAPARYRLLYLKSSVSGTFSVKQLTLGAQQNKIVYSSFIAAAFAVLEHMSPHEDDIKALAEQIKICTAPDASSIGTAGGFRWVSNEQPYQCALCGDETGHSTLNARLSDIGQTCPHSDCNSHAMIPSSNFLFGSSTAGFLSLAEAVASAYIAQTRDSIIPDALISCFDDTAEYRGIYCRELKLLRFFF